MTDQTSTEHDRHTVDEVTDSLTASPVTVQNARTEGVFSLDIPGLLRSLAVRRPIFHSEADFQHALAWEIQLTHPHADIRLEYRAPKLDHNAYIDIWVREGSSRVALELKYKTHRLSVSQQDEAFTLRGHSAHDCGRYDFLKDVKRLQTVVDTHPNSIGYAIFLTNDPYYWSGPRSCTVADYQFRLTEGREIEESPLQWDLNTGKGTMRGRESQLAIRNRPKLHWHDYSTVGEEMRGKFRYILVEVT
jgi:hypothetical protein